MLDCDLISSNKTYEQYSSEAFFDNTETHDSTGLDSDRILQFDGNDTVETDSDFDITDLTEAEIYERDPALLYTGYTFEDVNEPPSHPSATNKVANFALNKDKQIRSLAVDADLTDYEILINDDGKNVGIQCSTAFYEAVAKPVMCGLSKGATFNIENVPVSCHHIDYNRDSKCYEYNRVLHIQLGGSGKFSMGKVTIHLHHTKRSIQMQGGTIMPDQSKAPVWFLKAFVKERFAKLAKIKHYDIAAFNNVVKKSVEKHKGTEVLNNNCSKCLKQFSAKSIPTQCMHCRRHFHKSTCLPTHSSSCIARPSRPSPAAPVSSPLMTSMSGRMPGTSAGIVYENPLKRPRIDTDSPMLDASTLSISRVNTSSSLFSLPNPPLLSSENNPSSAMNSRSSQEQAPGTSAPTPSQSLAPDHQRLQPSQEPAADASSSSTNVVEHSTLNAEAPTFFFSGSNNTESTGNTANTRRKKTKASPISPENAKINYLNLELNAAKTRIVQLEATIDDQEVSINIQREKIKLLEQTQHNSANSKYGFNSNAAHEATYSTASPGSIPCHQVANHCPSLLLQCLPGSHHCHVCAHHSLQHQHRQPGHPPAEASVNAPYDQVTLLNEVRRALNTLNEGIAQVNAAVKEKKIEATKSTDKPFKESERQKKTDRMHHNFSKDNTEHIEVVSVEVINSPDADDSIASSDDFVPEVPAPAPSLNCKDLTSQQTLLMQ